jgi:hypothetical protein
MKKQTRFTVAALGVFAAAALTIASLAPAKAVIIAGPSVCVYYSDAKMKTAVGARGTGCCGSVISWGITTTFKKCERIYCTD